MAKNSNNNNIANNYTNGNDGSRLSAKDSAVHFTHYLHFAFITPQKRCQYYPHLQLRQSQMKQAK